MLDKIATYKEKMECLKKKIKKALTYPFAIVLVALMITAGLLTYVVPQFESLFTMFGAELPAMTKSVLALSLWMNAYSPILFGILIIIFLSFRTLNNHYVPFTRFLDKLLLSSPCIGTIINKAAIAKFSRTLAITFAAGLPLVEALQSVAGITGNILFAEATNTIKEEIYTGLPMHVALSNSQLFPNMVIQLIAIGEETGALEKMLNKIADIYEEDVDNAVDALSSLLEPIIMSVLGVLVGGLVIAMYLPMFKLGVII